MSNLIHVIQPNLPPLEDFNFYLKQIWESKVLTNQGPLHQQLEAELCKFLNVKYLTLFNNGMTALICASRALELNGEVITTPYSFIATTHSLLWNNLKPVFVDIDPLTLNLAPKQIEQAVTEKTVAILPVHCYGRSCDVTEISRIAKQHNLKVIYDGAHAFGVEDSQGSILNHGDLSILSFHATKVFNTFEGGAVVCHSKEMKEKLDLIKNFGIKDEITIEDLGLNGKMSEVNAAMGLAQLKYLPSTIKARQAVDSFYREQLQHVPGLNLLPELTEKKFNYSYFPILVGKNFPLSRDELYFHLKNHGIYARRYFYPLISNCSIYAELPSAQRSNLKIANQAADSVICLPIHTELGMPALTRIVETIKNVF